MLSCSHFSVSVPRNQVQPCITSPKGDPLKSLFTHRVILKKPTTCNQVWVWPVLSDAWGCWDLQRVLSRVQTYSDSRDHSKQHGLVCPKRGRREESRISGWRFRGESWSELRRCLKLPWNAAWMLKSEAGAWGRQSEDFAVTILLKRGFPELDLPDVLGVLYISGHMCCLVVRRSH